MMRQNSERRFKLGGKTGPRSPFGQFKPSSDRRNSVRQGQMEDGSAQLGRFATSNNPQQFEDSRGFNNYGGAQGGVQTEE